MPLTRADAELRLGLNRALPPTYDGPCRLLDWKQSARDGMLVDVRLGLPGPTGGHAFRGIPTGRENGQRFAVIVTLPRQADGGQCAVVHSGEALLMRWSENDRTGMMARLLLDDGPDGVQGRHPFFGLAVGNSTGEPLEIACWGISDEEKALPPSKLRQRTPFHQLTEVQQSQVLCRDQRFVAFLKRQISTLVPAGEAREGLLLMQDQPEAFASAAVRTILGVSSRAVMNRDGSPAMAARVRWRELLGRYEDDVWGLRH